MIRDATGNKEYEFGDGTKALSEASKEAAEKAATAVLDAGGTAVEAWVERFDRRGIEPFELFTSEFGQNSFKNSGIFARKFKISEMFNMIF